MWPGSVCVCFKECLFSGLLLMWPQLLEKLHGSHSLYGSCLGMPGDQETHDLI